MNLIRKYLINTVRISDDHRHIFDLLNNNVLTGYILSLQVAQIFSILKEEADNEIKQWFKEFNLTDEEITNIFAVLELIHYRDGVSTQLSVDTFSVTNEIKMTTFHNQRVPIHQDNRVEIKLSVDRNDEHSIKTILNAALTGEKFESSLFDNMNGRCYTLIGCFVIAVEHQDDEIRLRIVCDQYEIS